MASVADLIMARRAIRDYRADAIRLDAMRAEPQWRKKPLTMRQYIRIAIRAARAEEQDPEWR